MTSYAAAGTGRLVISPLDRDDFVMTYRLSRLLALSFCVLVLLTGCGDDATDDAPQVTEQPAAVDTADVPVAQDTASAVAEAPQEPASEPTASPAGSPDSERPGSESSEQRELRADFQGTTEAVSGTGTSGGAGTLYAVRAARHADFDRIVFEFTGGVPDYRIAYQDDPLRLCGSGGYVDLPGDAQLVLRMDPAQPYSVAGLLAVKNESRITRLPVIREHALVCDEDGQISWALGLSETSRYRAFTLSSPPRLVVDLRHGS